MSKSIQVGTSEVIVSLETKKGVISGKVVKNKHGYDVIITSSTFELTPKAEQSMRNKLRDWYFFNYAGQHDSIIGK